MKSEILSPSVPRKIQVFQPSLGIFEINALRRTISTNWVGRGAQVKEFEQAWAQHVDVQPQHIRSVNSATEGLFQIIHLLGLKKGDEVILPTISFVGAANAVVAAGATPVFCDVDRHTLNPTLDQLAAKKTRRTKAVILLHYGGHACLTTQYLCWPGVQIIEDSACSPATNLAMGAAGTVGNFGVWSFDAMKIMSAGDGGMVYFRDPEMAKRFDRSTYLGMSSESGYKNPADRWWEFEIECAGRRSIMNDLTASIGLSQLKSLKNFISRREEIYYRYQHAFLSENWFEVPPDYASSSFYFYWIQTKYRDKLAKYLRERDIYTTFRYWPLHRVKFYGSKEKLPEAEWAARNTLLLPIHQGMNDEDVARVIEEVRRFGKKI